MAILDTYTQGGNREDLIDLVTTVAYKKTPLLSSLDVTRATGSLHEWTTDSLDSAGDNAQIEGSDVTFGTLTPRTKLNNYCQILRKEGQISDTQEIVGKAGVKSEYKDQVQKKLVELARDTEYALWNGVKTAGAASSTARRMGGVFHWASTNRTSMATSTVTGTASAGAATTITAAAGHGSAVNDQILLTGGTGAGQYRTITNVAANVLTVAAWDVVPDATTTYIIYKTPKALTSSVVNTALSSAYDSGGEPDCIFVASKQKIAVSGFMAANRAYNDKNKAFTDRVDMMETDFGDVAVKHDLFVPAGTVAALELAKWRVANLRPVKPTKLAKTGSSEKFMVEAECTLESLGESASALVHGASEA